MTDADKIEAVKSNMECLRHKMTRVAFLRKRLAEIDDDINHPSIQVGGGGIKGGISTGSARLVLIKAEIEEQLKNATGEYNDEISALQGKLRQLPANDQTILEQRYIFGTSVREIMTELKISKSAYYEAHNKACVDLYNIN